MTDRPRWIERLLVTAAALVVIATFLALLLTPMHVPALQRAIIRSVEITRVPTWIAGFAYFGLALTLAMLAPFGLQRAWAWWFRTWFRTHRTRVRPVPEIARLTESDLQRLNDGRERVQTALVSLDAERERVRAEVSQIRRDVARDFQGYMREPREPIVHRATWYGAAPPEYADPAHTPPTAVQIADAAALALDAHLAECVNVYACGVCHECGSFSDPCHRGHARPVRPDPTVPDEPTRRRIVL